MSSTGGNSVKVKITYTPEEKETALLIIRFASSICGGVDVRYSDRHPPFLHIYANTQKKPKN